MMLWVLLSPTKPISQPPSIHPIQLEKGKTRIFSSCSSLMHIWKVCQLRYRTTTNQTSNQILIAFRAAMIITAKRNSGWWCCFFSHNFWPVMPMIEFGHNCPLLAHSIERETEEKEFCFRTHPHTSLQVQYVYVVSTTFAQFIIEYDGDNVWHNITTWFAFIFLRSFQLSMVCVSFHFLLDDGNKFDYFDLLNTWRKWWYTYQYERIRCCDMFDRLE